MTTPDLLDEQLGQSRERFLKFVRSRISDPDLAEDVLQASLVKAIENFARLKEQESIVPWFYSILRNSISDAYRNKARSVDVALPDDFDVPEDRETERRLCECFEALLPTLKPEYAELIASLDIHSEPQASVAQRLNVTANNLKVRHHRARQALKRRLDETCRVCAEHHCLDCTCSLTTTPNPDAGV